MKRIAFKLVLFVFAGAIVNFAVAWACALLLNPFDWPQGPFGRAARLEWYDHWSCYSNDIAGSQARMYVQTNGLDLNLGEPDTRPWVDQCRADWERSETLDKDAQTVFVAQGWPAIALWSKYEFSWRPPRISYGIQTSLHVVMRTTGSSIPIALPLRPTWPGFAINTIFYAAVLWLLFAFPFALRRRRRIKRGLCMACAYPVGHSAVCTECGTPRR